MSTFNVLRYSALGAGVIYGAVHRYNLTSAAEAEVAALHFKKVQQLIKEAKAEYARLNPPKKTEAVSGSINWEDPNLDIEKALEGLVLKLE